MFVLTNPATGSEITRKRLADAEAKATELAVAQSTEIPVLHAETEAVVFVATYVPTDRYFHAFERVETPKHVAPNYHGFVPAYVRKRIGATVYRGMEEFDKKGQWLIHDGRTGGHVIVANTKEACQVTKDMKDTQLPEPANA